MQIDQVESTWSIKFPDDYRRFLRILHATDRPMDGAHFEDRTLVASKAPGFCNWFDDTHDLREKFEWLVGGLVLDIEYNDLWLESWGTRFSPLR